MTDRWSGYWARPAGRPAGCLPEAGGLHDLLGRIWLDFARDLPRKARLLDLATGDGAVLRMMQPARRDLSLTGIDSAATLPSAPKGVRIRAAIAMERLPFPDDSFDAATSQFGIEYGDLEQVVGEVARVLRPGGRFCAVAHHAGGVIVRHNMARRAALAWAVGDSGILEKARRLAAARTASPLPTPPLFRATAAQAGRDFPDQPVAAEFITAVADTLDMGRTRAPGESIEILATLEERARGELQRLDALAVAALDEDAAKRLAGLLSAAGLRTGEPAPVTQAGEPVGWRLDAVA